MTHAPKTFQRRIENFSCEHCGFFVTGNGYTNHCPQCLHGKHVDIHPGDRLETCGGLMEPIATEKQGRQEKLVHHCLRCGQIRKNKIQTEDQFDALVLLSKKRVAEY